MIRRAKLPEIKDILQITRACALKMAENGIYQWNEQYPTEDAFLNDFERNELYVKDYNHQIIGAIVISTHMDEEYIPIQWLTKNENNIYIHRLSIDPELQGQGYAQKLMDFGFVIQRIS